MAIERRQLPEIPRGVDVSLLQDNLRLYSGQQVATFKKQFTENGRYRQYINQHGEVENLAHPVFVFNNRIFASYPGKDLRLNDDGHNKAKLAQDLESGEWVIDKVLSVDETGMVYGDEVRMERFFLKKVDQAVLAEGEPVHFYRPFSEKHLARIAEGLGHNGQLTPRHSSSDSRNEYSGSYASSEDSEFDADGKYYLFIKRASGMSVHNWLQQQTRVKSDSQRYQLPTIIKMDMSLALVRALQRVHEKGVLHRDVKPRNAVFDIFKTFNTAVNMVDFGLAVQLEELNGDLRAGSGTDGYIAPECDNLVDGKLRGDYSIKSDIYALGVTIGVLWDLIKLVKNEEQYKEPVIVKDSELADSELKNYLIRLLHAMIQKDAAERPDLQEIYNGLTRMRDSLSVDERGINVAVLDVDHFLECNEDRMPYAELMLQLRTFDMVKLADRSSVKSDRDLLAIKCELERNGLIVDPEVLLPTPKDELVVANAQDASGRCYHLQFIGFERQDIEEANTPERDSVLFDNSFDSSFGGSFEMIDSPAVEMPKAPPPSPEKDLAGDWVIMMPDDMRYEPPQPQDVEELLGPEDVEEQGIWGWCAHAVRLFDEVMTSIENAGQELVNDMVSSPRCFGAFFNDPEQPVRARARYARNLTSDAFDQNGEPRHLRMS